MAETDRRNLFLRGDTPSPCIDSHHVALREEVGRASSESAITPHAVAEDTDSQGRQKTVEETPSQEDLMSALGDSAAQTHPPATMMVPRRVPDTFKQVLDKERGIFVKVVSPYWKTLQTDVKMRWRGRQLLSVLTEEFRSRPLEYYTKALETGEYFFVNGAACRASTLLRNGDRLTHRTLETEFALPAEPVLVFHEDANILAAFKPPGMPVHPQGRYTEGSLLSVLKTFHLQSTNQYLHPINRLDRVTAGVVVFAKSPSYARLLTTALPSAVKLYVAEVHGDFRTCVDSVRKLQQQRLSPPLPSTRPELKEAPGSETRKGDSDNHFERTERNPLCCSEDESYAVDSMPTENSASSKLVESLKAAKETECCSEAQSAGATGFSERKRKKESKRLAKRARQLKRPRGQQLEHQQTTFQGHVGTEESCTVTEEFLTLQEATRREIFQVVPFPGCNLCGLRKGAVETQTSEGTTAAILCQKARREAAQGFRVQSGEACCCNDWLHVGARLQTSSRLVGRQLAVAWSEKCGKAASTFFKHLKYSAKTNTSLVACVPRTGRTHQIRKHLQCLQASSVVNDCLYGERRHEATETNGATNSEPQTPTVDACETGGERDRIVSKKDRASTERKVLASFSLEELRSVIGATTPYPCAANESCTGADKQITDGNSSAGQKNEASTLAKFFKDASTILGFQVSPAGDSVEVPYIIEEPWEIHLCSLAYGFTLEGISDESKAMPHSVKKKCRQHLRADCAEVSLHGGRCENLPSVDRSPTNVSHVLPTTRSPSSTDVSHPSDGCHSKRVFISCPNSIWPRWAKSVTDVINNSVWPLLQCCAAT